MDMNLSRIDREILLSETPAILGFGTGRGEEAKGNSLTRFIFFVSFLSTHHLLY